MFYMTVSFFLFLVFEDLQQHFSMTLFYQVPSIKDRRANKAFSLLSEEV